MYHLFETKSSNFEKLDHFWQLSVAFFMPLDDLIDQAAFCDGFLPTFCHIF